MSTLTYDRAKKVVEAAEEDPETFGPIQEEMDRTGKVEPAYRKVKEIRDKGIVVGRGTGLSRAPAGGGGGWMTPVSHLSVVSRSFLASTFSKIETPSRAGLLTELAPPGRKKRQEGGIPLIYIQYCLII
jgi:hypothetical protein